MSAPIARAAAPLRHLASFSLSRPPCTCSVRRSFGSSGICGPRQRSAWFLDAAKRLREDMPIEMERELEGEDATPEPSISGRPWYLDEDVPSSSLASYGDPSVSSTDVDREIASRPPPIVPPNLPDPIAELFSSLASMPHLDPHSITVIDAQAASDDGISYVDWICIATMRQGRERTFRGAADIVKASVQRALHPMYEPLRSKAPVLVDGLRYSDPTWVLVDAGPIQVHLMTLLARQTWDVAEHWRTPAVAGRDAPPHREQAGA